MKKIVSTLMVGLALGFAAAWLWLGRHHDEHEHAEKKEEHKEERVTHAENGDTIIKLSKEMLEHAGLKTAVLAAAEAAPERKAFGRVLDAVPLAASLSEMQTAEVVAAASKQELERQRVLEKQNNTSARAVQTAEAAARRDELQVGALRVKLMAAWGKAIGEVPQLHEQLGQIITLESALVRLDLAAGEAINESPVGARVFSLAKPEDAMNARYLGVLPTTDAQAQGQSLLFLVPANPQRLAPGAAVAGRLRVPGEARKGVLVPRDAVVRFNGLLWVYLRSGEGAFTRREVAAGELMEGGWFTEHGFKAGDEVVVTGAQQLLSEELRSAE